jgi:hypothetical protein
MKACIIDVSHDALKKLLGLPNEAVIVDCKPEFGMANSFYFKLHGVGDDVMDGAFLKCHRPKNLFRDTRTGLIDWGIV